MSAAALLRSGEGSDDFDRLIVIGDRLARTVQDLLSRRAKVQAKAAPITHARYAEWRIAQNPFGMLLRYATGRIGEELILHIPGYLVSQIIDIEYGGNGQVSARGAFSPAETRFVERLAEQLLPQIGLSVGMNQPCSLIEMQPDILAFNWPKWRDQIVVAGIFIECAAIKSATINCFMDIATARLVADRVADTGEAKLAADPAWTSKMRAATMRVHLPARAVLTRAELPASQLLSLAPGDILPVLLPTQVPLTVAGHQFARGTIGDANGRAALKIEHIEGIDHE
jgi:flagellar motor switch protein FliM